MVSIKENTLWWRDHYDWRQHGDEWSLPWGDPETQWYGSVLPRVHRFLPASRVLEIGCGFGRWTQFLRDHAEHVTALDLSETCIAACRERFADSPNVTCVVNDGTSLDMVEDSSIDFVFSFDSLVHADRATIEAYLAQFRRILTPRGAAFIHHSNLGEYSPLYRWLALTPKVSGLLRRMRVVEYLHIRDPSVSAAGVAAYAESVRLRCTGQELTTWLTRRTFIDCISTIVPAHGSNVGENRVVRNRAFRYEPGYLARLAPLYSGAPVFDGNRQP